MHLGDSQSLILYHVVLYVHSDSYQSLKTITKTHNAI